MAKVKKLKASCSNCEAQMYSCDKCKGDFCEDEFPPVEGSCPGCGIVTMMRIKAEELVSVESTKDFSALVADTPQKGFMIYLKDNRSFAVFIKENKN
jgi:hypothetical protein